MVCTEVMEWVTQIVECFHRQYLGHQNACCCLWDYDTPMTVWCPRSLVMNESDTESWAQKIPFWFPLWLLLVPVLHFPHNVLLSSGCCSCVVWFVIPSPQLMYLGQCRHNLLLELSTNIREVFTVPGERWLATWWKHILAVLRIYTEQACECKNCNYI